uniref:Uncharacterized protein n=1 Tax=Ailuropoda melanoleuca TaxID=9646 RepID=A0A7N5KBW0_AILME
ADNHIFKCTLSQEEATGKTRWFKDPGTGGIRSVSIVTMCHMPNISTYSGKQTKKQTNKKNYPRG